MGDKEILQLFEASIHLELNMAHLYRSFHAAYAEDSEFWLELSLEEENHATLLHSVKKSFLAEAKSFPHDLLCESLEDLLGSNAQVSEIAQEHKKMTRVEAFNTAFELEHLAGELHYQRFMKHAPASVLAGVFQQLNGEDKDHARRILGYMKEHGMEVTFQHPEVGE